MAGRLDQGNTRRHHLELLVLKRLIVIKRSLRETRRQAPLRMFDLLARQGRRGQQRHQIRVHGQTTNMVHVFMRYEDQ